LNIGARVEWVPDTSGEDDILGFDYDDDFFRVLPGVGASYRLTDQWALFANYFEGFRAPQAWGYAFAVENEDLDFELGRSAEIGTRVRGVAGFSGSLTLWRVEYDDFGVFYTGFYENLGNIESIGTDLALAWDAAELLPDLAGFSLSGSITFQDAEIESGPNEGNDVPYAWDRKAAWRARYEWRGWAASLGGVHVGEAFSDDANTREPSDDGTLGLNDGWTLWDTQLSKSLPVSDHGKLDVAVGVTNLFDTDWEVHSRGGFFGGGLVAGGPRQAYVTMGLTLRL
jgi:outer membrane receptor for Fe3+-dicitrate